MKLNKWVRTFFQEPDDNNGDGGVADLLTQPEITDDPNLAPSGDTAPSGDSDPEPAPVPAPTVQLTAADIAAAVAAAIPQQQPVAPAPAPKMSQEEINKLLKKPEIDDAFLEKFGNITTQKEALLDFAERVAAHAEARAQLHTYGELQRLQAQFAPSLKAAEELAAKQREDAFYREYADLDKPELRQVVNALAPTILSSKKFASQKEAFESVAKGVERLIQSTTPTFKLNAKGAKTTNPNALPTQSAGTGGGGNASAPAPRKGPPGIELFANLR